ncbi:MAG: hypothetical protein DMG13_08635 [Acidobacteria bacterium]|nr:MAG: hypothetical protein DMG13_08635 [Acidobacteriota bacterium]
MINALARCEFLGSEPARWRIAMARNSRADELEERLVEFAIDIVTLVGQLPHSFQSKHIATQLLHSGTAAAPNYGEWLRIIGGSFAVDADFLTRLVAENTELCKILVASIQTARRNNKADQG